MIMLFGYLIARNLQHVVRIITRAPRPVQNGFAATLNAATGPSTKSTTGAHAPAPA